MQPPIVRSVLIITNGQVALYNERIELYSGLCLEGGNMQAGKAFSYMFEDERWISKSLIGAVVNMVPILNFDWMGYLLKVLRSVESDEKLLPEWDDFGGKFMDGLKIFIAYFLYTLPATILITLGALLFIVPAVVQHNQDLQAILFGTVGLVFLLLCSVMTLYLVAFSILSPAIAIHYSRKGTFGSCFEMSAIFGLVKRNFGLYITAWLFAMLAGFAGGAIVSVGGMMLGWIPCIGQVAFWVFSALVSIWTSLVGFHLYGQAGKELAI